MAGQLYVPLRTNQYPQIYLSAWVTSLFIPTCREPVGANNPDTIRASQGAEYIRWYKLGGQADMLKKAFVEALF